MFTPADIEKYMFTLDVTDKWVSYRDPIYPANSWPPADLKIENRYNRPGEPVYYIASGIETARAEVPDWQSRPLHRVNAGRIEAFDLRQWSLDNGREQDFLRSKQQGGYDLCQAAALELKTEYGVSGILSLSAGQKAVGGTGYCLAWHTITGVPPTVFGPIVTGSH